MPRPTTLQEIDQAGHDLRLWCYACQHTAHLRADAVCQRFAARGLPLDLDTARTQLPCGKCGARDALILPATRGYRPDPATQAVAAFFHANRSGRHAPPHYAAAIERALRLRNAAKKGKGS